MSSLSNVTPAPSTNVFTRLTGEGGQTISSLKNRYTVLANKEKKTIDGYVLSLLKENALRGTSLPKDQFFITIVDQLKREKTNRPTNGSRRRTSHMDQTAIQQQLAAIKQQNSSNQQVVTETDSTNPKSFAEQFARKKIPSSEEICSGVNKGVNEIERLVEELNAADEELEQSLGNESLVLDFDAETYVTRSLKTLDKAEKSLAEIHKLLNAAELPKIANPPFTSSELEEDLNNLGTTLNAAEHSLVELECAIDNLDDRGQQMIDAATAEFEKINEQFSNETESLGPEIRTLIVARKNDSSPSDPLKLLTYCPDFNGDDLLALSFPFTKV
jgi:hypothetical protein